MRVIVHENLEKAIDSLEGDSFLMATWDDIRNPPVISVVEKRSGTSPGEKEVVENKGENITYKNRVIRDMEVNLYKILLNTPSTGYFWGDDYFKIVAFKERTPKLVEMNNLIREALKRGYNLTKALEDQYKKNRLDFLLSRRIIKLYYPYVEGILRRALGEVEEAISRKEKGPFRVKSLDIDVGEYDVKHLREFLSYVLLVVDLENLQLVRYKDGIPKEITSSKEGMDLVRKVAVSAKGDSRENRVKVKRIDIPITNDYGVMIRSEDSSLALAKLVPREEKVEDYLKGKVLEEEIVVLELGVEEKEDIIHLVPVERWKSEGVEGGFERVSRTDNVRFIAFSEFLIKRARLCIPKIRGDGGEVDPVYLESGEKEVWELGEGGEVVLDLTKSSSVAVTIDEERKSSRDWIADSLSFGVEERWKVLLEKEKEADSWAVKDLWTGGRFLSPVTGRINLAYNGDRMNLINSLQLPNGISKIEEGVLEMAKSGELLEEIREFVGFLRERIGDLVKRKEEYGSGEGSFEFELFVKEGREAIVDFENIFEELEKRFREWSKEQLKEVVEVDEKSLRGDRVIAKILLDRALGGVEVKNWLRDIKYVHIMDILGVEGTELCFNHRGESVYIRYSPQIRRLTGKRGEKEIAKVILPLIRIVLYEGDIHKKESSLPEEDIHSKVRVYIERLEQRFKEGAPKGASLMISLRIDSEKAVGRRLPPIRTRVVNFQAPMDTTSHTEMRYSVLVGSRLEKVGYLLNLSKGQLKVYVEGRLADNSLYSNLMFWK